MLSAIQSSCLGYGPGHFYYPLLCKLPGKGRPSLSTSTCMEQYGTRTYWCGRCSTSLRPVPGGAVRRPLWYLFNRYRNSTEEGLLPEAPREPYFCSRIPNTSMYY